MRGHYEYVKDAEDQERDNLMNKSIPKLKQDLINIVNNIEIPYNKELLIDIIIDMRKENGELPK